MCYKSGKKDITSRGSFNAGISIDITTKKEKEDIDFHDFNYRDLRIANHWMYMRLSHFSHLSGFALNLLNSVTGFIVL